MKKLFLLVLAMVITFSNVIMTFFPKNNEIVRDYTGVMKSEDIKTMIYALLKALPKLNDSDTKFVAFQTKLDSMKKDLGLVDVK